MRTALAHHFVSMLQERIYGRFRTLFVRWAHSAGFLALITTHVDPTWQTTVLSRGRLNSICDMTCLQGAPMVSTALQRLGLMPQQLPFPHSVVGNVAASRDDTKTSKQLGASFPTWMRLSLRVSTSGQPTAGTSEVPMPPLASASSRRTCTSSFAGHVIEEVLAERGNGRVAEYRVKWKGFASSRSVTWELGSHLTKLRGFDDALLRFRTKWVELRVQVGRGREDMHVDSCRMSG